MKDYLKMADVFVHDSVEELEQHIYAGYMSKHCSEYAAHAINSHDELVQMNNELLGIINRIIDTSTEMEGKDVSSSWSEGYKQCSIDTGKAISEMLCRIEGGEK